MDAESIVPNNHSHHIHSNSNHSHQHKTENKHEHNFLSLLNQFIDKSAEKPMDKKVVVLSYFKHLPIHSAKIPENIPIQLNLLLENYSSKFLVGFFAQSLPPPQFYKFSYLL